MSGAIIKRSTLWFLKPFYIRNCGQSTLVNAGIEQMVVMKVEYLRRVKNRWCPVICVRVFVISATFDNRADA
jgi:hypothetical protein